MGNHLSCKTDIEPYFDGPMPEDSDKTFTIRIQVPNVYDNFSILERDLRFAPTGYQILAVTEHSPEPFYKWTLGRSNARDFEVDAKTGRKYAQGQVIGVIIIECFNLYIMMIWPDFDKRKTCELEFIMTIWEHSEAAKQVLRKDLAIGYDILLLAGNDATNVYRLCESDGEQRKDASIFLQSLQGRGLENFEKYVQDRLKDEEKE